MTSVFVAFIPAGTSTIQQIAFGLAVGVFVDAFVVRMTLVPAVLMLLGDKAWWLPSWLATRMPVVDVEGAALHRKIAFSDWESAHGETTLLARDLVVREATPPTHVVAAPGRVTTVRVPEGVHPGELGQVLAGRRQPFAGEVVVDGLLLPEQREQVARRTALLEIGPFETAPVSPPVLFCARARLTSVERFATQGVRRHRADAAPRPGWQRGRPRRGRGGRCLDGSRRGPTST